MRRRSSGIAVAFASVMALTFSLAGTASATISNSCTVGEFGNIGGGTSQLKVACTLTTAVGGTSTFYKTEDFPEAMWHTGAARQITTTAAVSGGKTITASAGHFSTADINHSISGPGVPGGSWIVAETSTTATLSIPVCTGCPVVTTPTNTKLLIDNSDGRTVDDATISGNTLTSSRAHFCKPSSFGCGPFQTDVGRVLSASQLGHLIKITVVNSASSVTFSGPAAASCASTNAGATNCKTASVSSPPGLTGNRQADDVSCSGATITSAFAQFGQSDVGLQIAGTGIPAGDYIKSVGGATSATLNQATTSCSTGGTEVITIGLPDAGVPTNGSPVVELGSELTVQPTLVAGGPPCSANEPQGANLYGVWESPGSFDLSPTTLGKPTDASIKGSVLAQLKFPTSAGINFAAYVVQAKGGTASGDTDTAPHVDIVYPLLPTGIAVCPAPSTVGIATTFQYNGIALNQQTLSGAPGNTDVRSLADDITTSKTTTAYVHIRANSSSTTDAFPASSTCTQQFPDTVDFGCGNG